MRENCNSCGEQLNRTVVRYNGDEILLLTCVKEGLYAVIGMNGEPVIPSNETPETTEHIPVQTEYGDEIVLAANVEKGFYTTSESEVKKIVGEEN